ncbi:hypothetical protein MRB53_024036 [Persea americana]|uniref:Uncharacterized protein n=1 Tax=Persea americana TaxID=3435 RepID=A0ACC2LBL8_PERAE|nr:hypothetical protein MRB53_024036 [Persea americana]|eukprot:TRINITY_DN7956_c0_g2_i1.p1 TRINITY_DN7956_c0_g2~~TRINITY_DN7956_c0_g2_i1.p1  ORF type:complete len:400 (-),score=25.38 TRINITY_DN7956_c0_g2_i1:127-1326(-)
MHCRASSRNILLSLKRAPGRVLLGAKKSVLRINRVSLGVISSKGINNESQQSLVSWSDLPEEFLNLILAKLHFCDYLNSRRVCVTWRAAAKQLNQCQRSPFLLLPQHKVRDHCCFICPLDGRYWRLNLPGINKKCCYIGFFHGWLMIHKHHEHSGNTIFFLNPFTGIRIDLPQWEGFSENKRDIRRVAISSAPTDPNCTVIILDSSNWRFKFCKVGDDGWRAQSLVGQGLARDVVAFRGKFYFLGVQTTLPHRPSSTNSTEHLKFEYVWPPYDPHSGEREFCYYLVESGGELLLVRSDPMPTTSKPVVAVFGLDQSTLSWVEMKQIGNRVLFLGRWGCASFSATELGCKENQIYFTDSLIYNNTWWLFSMENGRVVSTPYLQQECPSLSSPIWITPCFV